MSESFDAYIARQAATVGRRAQPVARPVWVPQLPGAQGFYPGMLKGKSGDLGRYNYVDVFSEGHLVATLHPDGILRAWDLNTAQQQWEGYERHQPSARAIKVSPDGCWIISGDRDGTIRIWTRTSGECLFHCEEDGAGISRIAWSPDCPALCFVNI